MNNSRFPTFFISHGGGPWPYIEDMRQRFAVTAAELAKLSATLPAKPKAILMITGHWEAPQFTVSTSQHPPMEYDYYGFPEHTYHLQYPAPGNPVLAKRVRT
jgi:aromatic ring-opening dioxygenase catalytic subunit (LigB family)